MMETTTSHYDELNPGFSSNNIAKPKVEYPFYLMRPSPRMF
jgi:hypothetical protein